MGQVFNQFDWKLSTNSTFYSGVAQLKLSPNSHELLIDGRAPKYALVGTSYNLKLTSPRPGEIMKNPNLAKTFKLLADKGKAGFYEVCSIH